MVPVKNGCAETTNLKDQGEVSSGVPQRDKPLYWNESLFCLEVRGARLLEENVVEQIEVALNSEAYRRVFP